MTKIIIALAAIMAMTANAQTMYQTGKGLQEAGVPAMSRAQSELMNRLINDQSKKWFKNDGKNGDK